MEFQQYNSDEAIFKKMIESLKLIENKATKLRDHLTNGPKIAISEIAQIKTFKASIDLIDLKHSGINLKMLNEGFEAFYSSLKTSNAEIKTGSDLLLKIQNSIAVCKDGLKEREKQKKAYLHYLTKVQKLSATRDKKRLSNPNYLETPNDAERIIRNNRKYDTAKSNFMNVDNRCITEMNKLVDFEDETIERIISAIIKFYKEYYYGGSTSFNLCNQAIESASNTTKVKPEKFKLNIPDAKPDSHIETQKEPVKPIGNKLIPAKKEVQPVQAKFQEEFEENKAEEAEEEKIVVPIKKKPSPK